MYKKKRWAHHPHPQQNYSVKISWLRKRTDRCGAVQNLMIRHIDAGIFCSLIIVVYSTAAFHAHKEVLFMFGESVSSFHAANTWTTAANRCVNVLLDAVFITSSFI